MYSFFIKLMHLFLIKNFFKRFEPKNRYIASCYYESGPARLQLSLDGRRLYVSNSFLRSWDEYFYPNLKKFYL